MTEGPDGAHAYAVLGVFRDSTDAEVAAAYRRLARRLHPDVAGETGTVAMTRVNVAFDRIRTAALRAAYDQELRGAGIEPPARPPDQAGRGRRSWSRPEPRDGTGGAGPPPGRPSGSVLRFGRHIGWSIGEIARVDPGYLAWLEDHPQGRPYLEEIDRTLRQVGYRTGAGGPASARPPRRQGWGRRR